MTGYEHNNEQSNSSLPRFGRHHSRQSWGPESPPPPHLTLAPPPTGGESHGGGSSGAARARHHSGSSVQRDGRLLEQGVAQQGLPLIFRRARLADHPSGRRAGRSLEKACKESRCRRAWACADRGPSRVSLGPVAARQRHQAHGRYLAAIAHPDANSRAGVDRRSESDWAHGPDHRTGRESRPFGSGRRELRAIPAVRYTSRRATDMLVGIQS